MFGKTLGLSIAVLLMIGFIASEAQASETFTLRVLADFSSFDVTPGAAGGGVPFYVAGAICADTTIGDPCAPIGDFHCWGWIPPSGVGLVSQEYHLFGRGKIQTQGLEDEGPRAVVGGTGDFSEVSGEATSVDLSPFPPEFTITFDLEDADDDSD